MVDISWMGYMVINRNLLFRLFVIYSLLTFMYGCDGQNKRQQHPILVTAIKIHNSNIPLEKTYIGITKAIAQVDIKARVKGFLQEMNFVEGMPVKNGQLLFVIDQLPFKTKLDYAIGTLDKAKAEQEFQEVEYKRMEALVKKGDISKSRYDRAAAGIKEATANVLIAKSQVEDAKINLGYCSMHSPFDGIISKRYVDIGNLVGGTIETLLANVVQLNPIYVEFNPSVSDFATMQNYKNNMPFHVHVSIPYNEKNIFSGEIDLINNTADVGTSTILLRASIKNPENILLPGIYVNITVRLEDNFPTILVPSEAVLEIQGKRSVFVVSKDNKVESRSIVTDGQYHQQFIVTKGLEDGDIVITTGLQKVNVGTDVKVNFINQSKVN